MAITYEAAKDLHNHLAHQEIYEKRHTDLKRLRKFWHGQYWEVAESDTTQLSSVFRDMISENKVGPELKLVDNLLHAVCTKYQSFLSPLPMIRVFTDEEESNKARAEATVKERYLYGLWAQRPLSMNMVMNTAGWYLPLMGDCFLGIHPNFEANHPKPMIRSPEFAYPVPNYEDGSLEKVLFYREVPEEIIRASLGTIPMSRDSTASSSPLLRIGRRKEKEKIEVLEYSDKNEIASWVNGVKISGTVHEYGFNMYDQIGMIQVPDEPWNHGAVEQIVGLVEMGNALLSLSFQAVLENVFPTLFLINPMKMPEELNLGPGGVVPINEGGDVRWQSPPTQAVQAQLAMLERNEDNVKRNTNMPDVTFGQSDASIITGKAVNELQGAGTGSVVEMVQGTSLGTGLVSWNEKAIFMAQRMWKDDPAHLFGMTPNGMMDVNPKQFSLTVRGRDLKGSPRNDVTFSPHLNKNQKVVMGLQMAGAGLVSKKYQREQVGIPDNQAMEEEIISETIQDAVMAGIVNQLAETGAPTDQDALAAEQRALALQQGQTPPAAPATPLVAPPATPVPGGAPPPGAPPGGPSALPGGALPLPGLPPGGAAPTQEPLEGETDAIALDEAIAAFQSIDVTGRVFLIGEIVQTGQTRDDIEVDVTEPADRQTIASGLPQYRGRLFFRLITTEPDEPFVEVTPGATAEPQGVEDIDLEFEGEILG